MSILGLHVARIRSGLEAECANQVGGFVPLKRDKWISRGKQREALRAQMPGYIFVELDITDPVAWHKIAEGKGFSHFIPGQVNKVELDRIRATLDVEGVYVEPEREKPTSYKPGQCLKITNGPFAGNLATYLESSDDGKIFVATHLLGQATRLYMPSAWCLKSESLLEHSATPKQRRRRRRHKKIGAASPGAN